MLELIVTIALCGFVVWLVLQIPMPPVFRSVIIGLVSVYIVLWFLQAVGVHVPNLPVFRLK